MLENRTYVLIFPSEEASLMPPQPPDDPRRGVYLRLTDPTRKSPRGDHRYAYTEEQFDRKLKDERSLPLFEETARVQPHMRDRLVREQADELAANLGLSDRQVRICRMRLAGRTALEISEELGLSERRVRSLLQDLRKILESRLRGGEREETPGEDPYYGWQEVFLDSQRR
jgi:DNA-binding CsgD family transcriptional regulator